MNHTVANITSRKSIRRWMLLIFCTAMLAALCFPSTSASTTSTAHLRQLQTETVTKTSSSSTNTISTSESSSVSAGQHPHHHHAHKHLHNTSTTFHAESGMASLKLTRIPPFIYRTYSDPLPQLHTKLVDLMKATVQQNPDFIQVYYSDEAIVKFIEKHYPQYADLYHSLIPGAYRADVWRLLVLYHFGGIYADMGTKFLRPIREFVKEEDEFVIPIDIDQTATWNAFMAFSPRHPLLRFVLDWVLDMIRHQRYGCNNLDITGPKAIGRALNQCRHRPDNDVFTAGVQEIQGYKVHFLQFTKELHAFDGNNDVIQNKFEGFYEIVYGSKHRLPYGAYYYNRNAYKNATNKIEERYNGALAHAGRSYWYITNNQRRPFPNWDTFLSLGMSSCTGCELRKGFDQIPIGDSLSADNQSFNWELIHANYPQLPCKLPSPKTTHERHGGFSSGAEAKKYIAFYDEVLKKHRGQVISDQDFEILDF